MAASGMEALEIAARLRPDVVLMDINMPGMDGIATTEQLSASVPTASIVMMSVQGEADYLRRSMLAGAREFLVKPFSSDELCSSIRQVYAREREKLGRVLPAVPANQMVPQPAAPGIREPGTGHHALLAQGWRRPDHARRQPRRRARLGDGPLGRPRGRQPPVRRRGRAAQPEPQEQVHRGRPGRRGQRRRRPHRQHPRQPQHRRPRPARTAQPGDGRAGHRRPHPARRRPPARHPRPGDRRQLAVLPGQHARAPGHVGHDPRAC